MPAPVLLDALGVIDQIDIGVPGGRLPELAVEEQARGILEPQGVPRRMIGRRIQSRCPSKRRYDN